LIAVIVTPDQRLRVFVSSTLGELAKERAAVKEAVASLRLSPVLFELGARPHPPRHLYRAYLEQSHIFLGIYWQSYGWMAPGMQVSGIEDEYGLAKGLPRLIYVRRPAPDRDPRLQAFLDRVESGDDVCYKTFSSPEELRGLVAEDLAVLLTERFQAATLPTARAAGQGVRPGNVADEAAALPSGDVTFLFTDIEGSTRLWEQYPDAMPATLGRHKAVVRKAVEDHGGTVVRDTGDGLFAAFASAADGVAAAVEAQCGLQDVDWGVTGPLATRMGLHSGQADPIERDYHGPAVNRCAGIMNMAHGGQVIVSAATCQRAGSAPAPQVSFLDLGPQRLRDLSAAVRVYQVQHPRLRASFPALRSLDAFVNNLPAKLSSFVGRQPELRRLAQILDATRLLTLTGAGGVGKTRLALQLSADRAHLFEDGVWLVNLASITDPTLVAPELASVLRIGEQPGRTWVESLLWHLRERETLLVLDNCEHLLDEVASLVETILRSCPRVRILVTSREALAVLGEAVWHVAPLSVSADRGMSEAEQLFVDRAREADLEFQPTGDIPADIAQICHRLDGIPLAIELAAARVRVLSVTEITERLDQRFRLLTGGSRTALPRQRTLEATVAWSYELLHEPERRLFERLSVFAGSFTLDAVEQVCVGGPVTAYEILDLVTRLVERSMLVHERAGPPSSYRLLETMRAYGRDRLAERGELLALRDAHLAWISGFARSAARLLEGPEQVLWLDRVSAELDDIRLALTWAPEGDSAPVGLECAANLFWFWFIRGVREGRQWLDRLLAAVPDAGPEILASALLADGTLILEMGDNRSAAAMLERSLAMYREIGGEQGAARALTNLGRAEWALREPGQVKARLEEALRICRRLGDTLGTGFALQFLGMWEAVYGDTVTAVERMDELAVIARRTGMPLLVAHAAEFSAATRWRASAGAEQVRPLLREALQIYRRLGSLMCAAHCAETTAAWASEAGASEAGARLLGATEALREEAGTPVPPSFRALFYETTRERLLAALGEDRYRVAVAHGRSLGLEAAIDAALAVLEDARAGRTSYTPKARVS
jgi:predicted ATPase/class 3 adenylate cyclase